MTSQQAYDRFLGIYQERSQRHFDPTWALEVMNDAIDDLRVEVTIIDPEYFSLKSAPISYTVDVQEKDLPLDVITIDQVFVTDRGGPPYPRLTEIKGFQRNMGIAPGTHGLDWVTGGGKGEPYFYYVVGPAVASDASKIGFVPIPSRTAANNVTVVYHNRGADLTSIGGSIPDLPLDWHPLLAWRMCILAATSDNNPNLMSYVGQYNARLEKKLILASRGRGEGQEYIEDYEGDW